MKKLYAAYLTILALAVFSGSVLACSDIFINQSKGHIEGRIMDFSVNVANDTTIGFIGQKNTTDVVIDAAKIPPEKLSSWTNKYGYWGRSVFNSPKIDDGLNTEGLSISGLYLEDITKYPAYDNNDKRQVLGIYDIGAFLLGQCSNVNEALKLLHNTQLVQSAIQYAPGVFIKDIPIHLSLRDAKGNSAVIEFIGGGVQIYENAGNVMTNGPAFPEQLANAKKYDNILPQTTNGKMTGMPGGYKSDERFVRGYILTRSMPVPTSHQIALYQADMVIGSLLRPYFAVGADASNASSIWMVIKDLDEKVIYEKNIMYYQNGTMVMPEDISNGYRKINLQAIDWNTIPMEYMNAITQPTPVANVKKIISAKELPGF